MAITFFKSTVCCMHHEYKPNVFFQKVYLYTYIQRLILFCYLIIHKFSENGQLLGFVWPVTLLRFASVKYLLAPLLN